MPILEQHLRRGNRKAWLCPLQVSLANFRSQYVLRVLLPWSNLSKRVCNSDDHGKEDNVDCCGGAETTMPFTFALLAGTGIAISLGHCVGMCGPLVGAVSVSQRADGAGSITLFLRLLIYHLGRLSGYMFIGAVLGLLGSATLLTSDGKTIQGGLSILVGVFMLLLGIGLLGWLPTQRWLESGRVQGLVAGRLQRLLSARSMPARWALGLANGFLPCGPVYTVAMTSAATGSPGKGALAMLFFGLGTVPVLLALGLGAAKLSATRRRFFNRLGAVLVLAMALQLILRGLAAWSLVGHLRYGEVVIW